MEKKYFPLIFWGFVTFVLLSFMGVYMFVFKPTNDPNAKVLWSALVFLFVLVGVIATTAFINRKKTKAL